MPIRSGESRFAPGLRTNDEPVVQGAVFTRILVCSLHCFVEVSDHAFCDRGASIGEGFPLVDMYDQGLDGAVPFLGDGVKEGASVAAADALYVGAGRLQVSEEGVCLDGPSLDGVASL
jgi:hypothetical protein